MVSKAVPAGGEVPAGVLAAAVLAAEQVSFVLVGSAALWLRGEQINVGDADVVIEPGETSLRQLGALTGLPIRDLIDLTARDDYWFACLPASGTSLEELRDQLLKVHGLADYISVGLPRPLPTMIRSWARTHHHEDLNASLAALENALASPSGERET